MISIQIHRDNIEHRQQSGRIAVYAAFSAHLGLDMHATVSSKTGLARDPATTTQLDHAL